MEKLVQKIHFKTEIRATPNSLYRLITTASGWDSCFTRGTVFKLEKNGECLFSWKDWGADRVNETERAVDRDFKPDRFLKFDWNFFLTGSPTTVEISLTPRAESTLIEIIQTGFPKNESGLQMFGQCSMGWAEAMTLLKVYAEHGINYN
jgi:uncharacterized protein YndB with AHSA1/START domain